MLAVASRRAADNSQMWSGGGSLPPSRHEPAVPPWTSNFNATVPCSRQSQFDKHDETALRSRLPAVHPGG